MQVNDKFPTDVVFKYIPINLEEPPLACSQPILFKFDQKLESLEGKSIAIVSVPGAFTPTCTENHIPPFVENLATLKKDKNIGLVVVLSANDAFVLNAWGKLLLADKKDVDTSSIVFASDPNAEFAQKNGLSVDASANGMGIRTARFALVVDSERTVKYLGVEQQRGVSVSGYEAIVKAKL
ncbi:peroxiredoxin Ahp1p [[Candida] anglica]|uniref:Peroxiredoxin Ahp1p n=1 Tax=[Candida] anglica TaxID=148631 RepID=A0ABP0E7H3_9ASCO